MMYEPPDASLIEPKVTTDYTFLKLVICVATVVELED